MVEPTADDNYFTFPVDPMEVYRIFRHTWVLVRKKRPDVVVIEGKRPSATRSTKENAKYFSLFFRPWTLLAGNTMVPNIALLGCVLDKVQELYDKSLVTVPVEGKRAMFMLAAQRTSRFVPNGTRAGTSM